MPNFENKNWWILCSIGGILFNYNCNKSSAVIVHITNIVLLFTVEPVVELKDPLKIRIVLPKPTPKSDKKKKSEKTSPKEHSTNKIKKIKHKNLQKLSVCQEKGVPKSLESKMDDIINSAPQNYVKQLTNNLNDKNNAELFERKLNSITDLMEKDIDFTNSNFSPKDTQLLIQAQMKMNVFFKFIRDMLEDVKKMYIEAQETKKTLNHIVSKYNLQQTLATVTEEKDKKHQNNGISLLKETEQDKMECEADNNMENDIKAYEENDDSFIIKEEDLFNEQDTDMENISDNEIFTDGESSLESTPPPSSDVKRKENYNKKDSTWTLKHRHPGKGLIQLGHGVYISAKGLEEAKKTSKDVRTFTRHLFREVFTKEALENCSMTGSKPSFGRHVDVVRPALHNHARTVIFTYAMNYSRDVNWKNIKLSELVHSLRCMLQNNRRDRRRGRLVK